jgi:hypothetical protein
MLELVIQEANADQVDQVETETREEAVEEIAIVEVEIEEIIEAQELAVEILVEIQDQETIGLNNILIEERNVITKTYQI